MIGPGAVWCVSPPGRTGFALEKAQDSAATRFDEIRQQRLAQVANPGVIRLLSSCGWQRVRDGGRSVSTAYRPAAKFLAATTQPERLVRRGSYVEAATSRLFASKLFASKLLVRLSRERELPRPRMVRL